MKITKSDLTKIIREEILKEMMGNKELAQIRQLATPPGNKRFFNNILKAYGMVVSIKDENAKSMAHDYFVEHFGKGAFELAKQYSNSSESGKRLELTGVDLKNIDLRNADFLFQGAVLNSADLRGADLSGADLHGAYFNEANLSGAKMLYANLNSTIMYNAKLTDADLTDADLRGASLTGARLTGANLFGVDFRGATLTNLDLTGADLTGANMTGATKKKLDLRGANLTGVIGLRGRGDWEIIYNNETTFSEDMYADKHARRLGLPAVGRNWEKR